MGISRSLDIPHTALLVLDCQAGIVSIYAKPPEEFVARGASVIRTARTAAMPIIFVQVGFRPGLPEVSERNKLVAALKANPQHQRLFQGDIGEIHPGLGATPDDIVVTKHRVSAFTGTDLAMVLGAKEIHTLVLFGVSTSGAVLSTLLDAFDADYRVYVVGDGCADTDQELHDALVRRMFPARAEVITASEFVEAVSTHGPPNGTLTTNHHVSSTTVTRVLGDFPQLVLHCVEKEGRVGVLRSGTQTFTPSSTGA